MSSLEYCGSAAGWLQVARSAKPGTVANPAITMTIAATCRMSGDYRRRREENTLNTTRTRERIADAQLLAAVERAGQRPNSESRPIRASRCLTFRHDTVETRMTRILYGSLLVLVMVLSTATLSQPAARSVLVLPATPYRYA